MIQILEFKMSQTTPPWGISAKTAVLRNFNLRKPQGLCFLPLSSGSLSFIESAPPKSLSESLGCIRAPSGHHHPRRTRNLLGARDPSLLCWWQEWWASRIRWFPCEILPAVGKQGVRLCGGLTSDRGFLMVLGEGPEKVPGKKYTGKPDRHLLLEKIWEVALQEWRSHLAVLALGQASSLLEDRGSKLTASEAFPSHNCLA